MKALMTFGEALQQLKLGKSLARVGWNAKKMHIYLEDGYTETIPAGVFKGEKRVYEPVVTLFNAQGHHQPGWVCSQADMLADDWEIVTHE